MTSTIRDFSPIVLEVPRNVTEEQLKQLRETHSSQVSIRNEVPEIYQLTFEWNERAIESAKEAVLGILGKWEGERPQQFMLVFTGSSRNNLVEIASATYSIKNGEVEIDVTECLAELYDVLHGSDFYELLSPLIRKPQSNSLPEVVLRSKSLTIHSVIQSMNFKSFENNLDAPPLIYRHDVSQQSMSQALSSTASTIQKMLAIQKRDQGPYKFSFTLPQSGKISVRTSRVQGLVNFKCKNLEKEGINAIRKTIEEQEFKILNLNVTGLTINAATLGI